MACSELKSSIWLRSRCILGKFFSLTFAHLSSLENIIAALAISFNISFNLFHDSSFFACVMLVLISMACSELKSSIWLRSRCILGKFFSLTFAHLSSLENIIAALAISFNISFNLFHDSSFFACVMLVLISMACSELKSSIWLHSRCI